MTIIVYILPDGSKREVTADRGTTVMATALAEGVPGIVAECGGSCSCATCHVYVESSTGSVTPIHDIENEMLEGVMSERKPNSRLSCQIVAADDLEHLVVRVAERQM